MATAKHRAIDHFRRNKLLDRKHEELGDELEAIGANDARSRRGPRRRRRRRPAAADLHGLPSGAFHRGARRAHAAPARRPHHRRDRARVPRARADDRAAHRPGQADARRGARALRGAARRRRGPRGSSSVLEVDLSHLQRGLLGDGRRRLDAARAVRGRAAARAHPGRARAAGARGARPRGADGDPGVAMRERASAHPASRSCCSIKTGRSGIRLLIRRGLAALDAPSSWAARAARMRFRPRSPRVTRALARRTRRTGRGSPRLYGELAALAPSPVVELNRAVAVGMAFGAGRRPRDRRRADRGAVACQLPPAAGGARRLSQEARPPRRGARRVRARSVADTQRTRARAPARARRRLRTSARMIVHLIDGTYELFRHFYGNGAQQDGDRPFGAVRGVLGTVAADARGRRHSYRCRDRSRDRVVPQRSLGRTTRRAKESSRRCCAQFLPLEDALVAMGVTTWPMVELEADDALASAAHLASQDKRVEKVSIWTPDKDLAQCVVGDRGRAGGPPKRSRFAMRQRCGRIRRRSRSSSLITSLSSAMQPTDIPASRAGSEDRGAD